MKALNNMYKDIKIHDDRSINLYILIHFENLVIALAAKITFDMGKAE